MPKIVSEKGTTQIAIRLDVEQLARIERYAARASKAVGIKIGRADAVRALIERGLAAVEREDKRTR